MKTNHTHIVVSFVLKRKETLLLVDVDGYILFVLYSERKTSKETLNLFLRLEIINEAIGARQYPVYTMFPCQNLMECICTTDKQWDAYSFSSGQHIGEGQVND
jgi:hypothetical protein